MRKITPSNKILLVIPFWSGDRLAAMGLADLLDDIQPSHSEDIDILFVARFDCPQVDATRIKRISRKFNIMTHISKRRETGWPAGCSGIFFGAMEFIYHKMVAGKIPGYKAIYICGADTIPLSRDCFAYLHRQWDSLSSRKPLCMAGALVPDGGKEHINGDCCLLSGGLSFLKWLVQDVGGMKVPVGWDYGLAGDFKARGWANIPGIISLWNTPTMSAIDAEVWAKRGVIWLHGVKDDSLLQYARRVLV